MADEEIQEGLEELQPLDPETITADEALEASDAAVADEDDAAVLVDPGPAPLGQTIAMDFESGTSIRMGRGPLLVRRDMALRQWIEKCLRTHQGAHPIHPDGYGLTEPLTSLIGMAAGTAQVGEAEGEIRDALRFHPAIDDVIDFEAEIQEPDVAGDATVNLSFVVLTDDGAALPVTTTLAGEALV